MLGSSEVDRVYCGGVIVWERNSSPLPEGYTQLNYIQSSGAQWLSPQMETPAETDIIRVECKFAFVSLDSSWQAVVAYDHNTSGGQAVYTGYGLYFGGTSSEIAAQVAHPSGSVATRAAPQIAVSTGTDYTADITVNASATGSTVSGNTFAITLAHAIDIPLVLFAARPSIEWGYREFASVKMYYCRIYKNGTLVHDLLPCSRNADNKIGMYDIVAGAFRTNGGSGADFTGG